MMDETQLDLVREQINGIDEQLLELLNRRANLALKACAVKDGDAPIYDPARESEVLTRTVALNKGPLPKGSVEDIYATIITACRELQLRNKTGE